MVRTIVAHGRALVRGALAFVLCAEPDIEVVAETGDFDALAAVAATQRPDVAVIDLDLLPPEDLSQLWRVQRDLVAGAVVLSEARRFHVLEPLLVGQRPGLGFLAKEGSPSRLVAAVRAVARREPVVDPELAAAAVRTSCPLTPREAQVLSVAAEGVPITEIALRLALSQGTVRNHLSRVIGKLGARTRIEAVRMAQEAGWI